MKLNKRILCAINEGVSTALMLDDTDQLNIINKSSKLTSNDIKRNTEKSIYSKKLLEMLPIPLNLSKDFIDKALKLHEKYSALYNPHLDDDYFRKFILKCVRIQGNKTNLNLVDTSDVTDMSFIFLNSQFNGNISEWDVSNVTNMSYMFEGSQFNGDISNWDVSNVIYMNNMFELSQFNMDISGWNVSNVIDMMSMFLKSKFNGDISGWNVSSVEYTRLMFYNCPIPNENKPKSMLNY